eukprot:EG_transcript_6798
MFRILSKIVCETATLCFLPFFEPLAQKLGMSKSIKFQKHDNSNSPKKPIFEMEAPDGFPTTEGKIAENLRKFRAQQQQAQRRRRRMGKKTQNYFLLKPSPKCTVLTKDPWL